MCFCAIQKKQFPFFSLIFLYICVPVRYRNFFYNIISIICVFLYDTENVLFFPHNLYHLSSVLLYFSLIIFTVFRQLFIFTNNYISTCFSFITVLFLYDSFVLKIFTSIHFYMYIYYLIHFLYITVFNSI